jgi:uncharacterized membrane protein
MIAEFILVAMIALLVSNKEHKWKMLGLFVGSLGVILSHYSTATFWFVFLFMTVIGYLVTNQNGVLWMCLFVLVISFYLYCSTLINFKRLDNGDFGNAIDKLSIKTIIQSRLQVTYL